MDSKTEKNSKILHYSLIFTIMYTIMALIWGFFSSSQVILFDGINNLFGIFLSYVSILSIKFIRKQDSDNYPFGKETFEPFIAIAQYCILLFISITNIVNAIQIILEGGRNTALESGVLYGAVTTIFSFTIFMFLKYLAKNNCSAIEEVEVMQWRFGFLFSLAVFFGFSIGWILTKTPLAPYVQYVDPVMSILITTVFVKASVVSIINCMKDLLIAKPSQELTSLITEKVNHINKDYNICDMVLRLGKVSEQLVIEIDYVINEDSQMDSICMQDELREKLDRSLKEVPYEKWLNVNFIGDIKWAD